MKNYIVATVKPWHLQMFKDNFGTLPNWHLIEKPADLTPENIKKINPKYIFFPHWSWLVPEEITTQFNCVCFHSTDLPFGRGGSPIQNLIKRGYTATQICALRMVKELDSGPIYTKAPLSLMGKAQDIFEKSAEIISQMMKEIADTEPTPIEQSGEPVIFKRLQGDDNLMPHSGALSDVYNHIRMLDADSYPKSHLIYGKFILEFTNATLDNNHVIASVKIKELT